MPRPRWSVRLALLVLAVAMVQLPTTEPAQAARGCNYFEFTRVKPTDSVLQWRYFDDLGRCLGVSTWRAGSGVSTDPCAKDQGWLPNGWYDSQFRDPNYPGDSIRGRVWRLSDKSCGDTNLRDGLFIHTEETVYWNQECSSNIDDPWCWDATAHNTSSAPGTRDFRSNGCIKVRRKSPEGTWIGDMGNVWKAWAKLGIPNGQFESSRLWVHTAGGSG